MNMPAPVQMRCGDYARSYPCAVKHDGETDAAFQERHQAQDESNRTTARDIMRRQGCRSLRFEVREDGYMTAHGYVGRVDGPTVEQL